MDCLFCLASLFIQVDSGYQFLQKHPDNVVLQYDRNGGSPIVSAFSVGLEGEVTSNITMSVFARHESMPTVYDYGINAVWVRATWRPFK